MPALEIDDAGVPDVASFGTLLNELLTEAETVKQATTIEPALQKSQFNDLSRRVGSCFAPAGHAPDTEASEGSPAVAKSRRNAVVETAARSLFDQLIVRLLGRDVAWLLLTISPGIYSDRRSRLRADVELPRPPLDTF
jgi:THO complex subunit 1